MSEVVATRASTLCFASIGECMVEMVPAETPGTYRMGFAGDTFNTAWYAKALRPDWHVRYVSRVGTDAASDALVQTMKQAGIDTTHIGRDAARSVGLYLISLNNGERSFSYWRDRSAARLLADDAECLAASVQDADVIYLSGITLAILTEDTRQTVFSVLKDARAQGKIIVFDSNLRPRLWDTADQMRRAVMRAAQISDIALPSFEDDAAAFGDASIQATAGRYGDAGAATVVVKNGPGEVCFLHQGQFGTVQLPTAPRIVDTTSAGDSFNAAFLAGLDSDQPIRTRISKAAEIATQVIGQKGALVPLDLGGWSGAQPNPGAPA